MLALTGMCYLEKRHQSVWIIAGWTICCLIGCTMSGGGHSPAAARVEVSNPRVPPGISKAPREESRSVIAPVHFQTSDNEEVGQVTDTNPAEDAGHENLSSSEHESLETLVDRALQTHPGLRQMELEVRAARARIPQIRALPDPSIGANFFGHPIETAAGSQRANIGFRQVIPSLRQLDARSRQAALDAMALEQQWLAERWQVEFEVRRTFYRLYTLEHEIRINRANQELLETLIEIANSRVATGTGPPGDVMLGTLERSRLEEELISLKQSRVSRLAELNRLVGRPPDTPVKAPKQLAPIELHLPSTELRRLIAERQPEITAARIREQAAQWGIEVARLSRRPELSLNSQWYVMDNNRPPSSIVDVGQDAWSIGTTVSIPLWRQKYVAMEDEAIYRRFAATAKTTDLLTQYDFVLTDIREQLQAAEAIAQLYRETIIPQAEQTLAADQEAYAQPQSVVGFDRVIDDLRAVLQLQVSYHQTIERWATSVARMEQITATRVSQPLDH